MFCWTFILVPGYSVICVRRPHLYPKSTKPYRKQARQVLYLCRSESAKLVLLKVDGPLESAPETKCVSTMSLLTAQRIFLRLRLGQNLREPSAKPVPKRSADSFNLHRKLNASPRSRSSRRARKGVTVQRTPAAVGCKTSLMLTGYLVPCSRPASCTRMNRQPNLGHDNSSLGLKIWASVYVRCPSSCTIGSRGRGVSGPHTHVVATVCTLSVSRAESGS